MGKYAGTGFVRPFSPLVSTGGTAALLWKWLELVYASPFLSVSREIITTQMGSQPGAAAQTLELALNFVCFARKNTGGENC